MEDNKFNVDRREFSVVSLEEQNREEKNYWHDKSPAERMEALEITRQLVYGYDPSSDRLQRVFEVVEQTQR